MKTVLTILFLGLSATAGSAQSPYSSYGGYGYGTGSNQQNHSVQGHVTPQGTYVQPHHSTNPNSTTLDNYSTNPNVNPYTGQVGTRRGNPW